MTAPAASLKRVPTSGGPWALRGLKNPRARTVVPSNLGIKLVYSIMIRSRATPLYEFWREPANLGRILTCPTAITAESEEDSHWVMHAPAGDVRWDVIIINDEPDRLLAWRSREGSEIAHAGTVRFEPTPGKAWTEVIVTLEYASPGGWPGATAVKLARESIGTQIQETLRRFKALMESGSPPVESGPLMAVD